jgi:hypothetical protein
MTCPRSAACAAHEGLGPTSLFHTTQFSRTEPKLQAGSPPLLRFSRPRCASPFGLQPPSRADESSSTIRPVNNLFKKSSERLPPGRFFSASRRLSARSSRLPLACSALASQAKRSAPCCAGSGPEENKRASSTGFRLLSQLPVQEILALRIKAGNPPRAEK